MYRLLKHRDHVFTTQFETIYYCVPEDALKSMQKFIAELKNVCPQIKIITGIPESKLLLQHPLPKIFIIDDMMDQLKTNPYVKQMFVRDSHHENASIVIATQQYFEVMPTIRNNLTYKVIFNDPTSDLVTRTVSSQLVWRTVNSGSSFLSNCFQTYKHNFPHEKYPYIVIDSEYASGNEESRVRTNVFPFDEEGTIIPICFLKNPNYKT